MCSCCHNITTSSTAASSLSGLCYKLIWAPSALKYHPRVLIFQSIDPLKGLRWKMIRSVPGKALTNGLRSIQTARSDWYAAAEWTWTERKASCCDFAVWLNTRCSYSSSSIPLLLISPHVAPHLLLLAHLLVLALLRGQLLQHAAVPDGLQLLPQGALARWWHRAAPGGAVPRPGHRSMGPPLEVHAGLADVAANCLPSDLLGDDGGAVILV